MNLQMTGEVRSTPTIPYRFDKFRVNPQIVYNDLLEWHMSLNRCNHPQTEVRKVLAKTRHNNNPVVELLPIRHCLGDVDGLIADADVV